jgi:hypothetical protein
MVLIYQTKLCSVGAFKHKNVTSTSILLRATDNFSVAKGKPFRILDNLLLSNPYSDLSPLQSSLSVYLLEWMDTRLAAQLLLLCWPKRSRVQYTSWPRASRTNWIIEARIWRCHVLNHITEIIWRKLAQSVRRARAVATESCYLPGETFQCPF